MLKQSKKMMAKMLVIYSMGAQVFAASSMPATVAEGTAVVAKKVKHNSKKVKKYSKQDIVKKLKQKLNLYNKRASAQKAAWLQAEHKAKRYLDRINKAKTLKGRHMLIKARIKVVKSITHHKQKYNSYTQKSTVVTEKLWSYADVKKVLVGKASWYGGRWAGRRTASGERFNPSALTAAMRAYRGHKVRVVNLSNKKSVVVRVNDHGPAGWTGRVIDLSQASFSRIASTNQGVIGKVKIYVY